VLKSLGNLRLVIGLVIRLEVRHKVVKVLAARVLIQLT
jgi:hypothetical protein